MASRIPNPVRGVNLLALPLTTLEGFILSRVDGATAVEDIALMTGVGTSEVAAILDRLAELGAVELPWSPKKAATSARAEPERAADAHFNARRARYGVAELEANVNIPIEARKRILNAFYALEGRNFYQLLGVRRDADKKAVRNAYFELSKLFHPDAYFGKDLGHFKPKMEAVFKALTEAYEVLGRPKKRAEYDEYLMTTEQTQRARQTLDSIELTREEIEKARRASQTRMPAVVVERVVVPQQIATPVSDSQPARAASRPEPAPAAPVAPRPQPTNAERRARVRDRLRQHFNAISQRPPTPSPPSGQPPSEEPDDRRRSLIDGLRQTIKASSAINSTPHAQVQLHLKRARDAEQAGDALLAASQLQAGLAVDPGNQDLLAEYDKVSKVVARALASNYEKQAVYEEKTGNWAAAAKSWTRVSDGRPEDAEAARRAAEAMLKAGDDLHRTQKYAQKAVSLEARSLPNLTLLARVYLAAGLKLNALRELEKAALLAPNDEMVNNLLREAR